MRSTLLIVVIVSSQALAFQHRAPDSLKQWKHSLVSALTFTQVSYSNWTQGGQNSLAYTVSADGKTYGPCSSLATARTFTSGVT